MQLRDSYTLEYVLPLSFKKKNDCTRLAMKGHGVSFILAFHPKCLSVSQYSVLSIKVKNIPEKEKEKVIEQEVEQSLIQDLSRCQEDELCSKTVGAPNG